MGIRMCHASFQYETFVEFSKQSYNFSERECSQKWHSFRNYDKNMCVMVNFLKKYDITIAYTEEIDLISSKLFYIDYRCGSRVCDLARE